MSIFRVNSDLQSAIDSAVAGDTIILGAGVYSPATADGFTINKRITIQGSGKPYQYENLAGVTTPDTYIGWTTGTIIRPYSTAATSDGSKDSTAFKIVGPVTGVVIRDLGIENPYIPPNTRPVTPGTGDGIYFDATTDYVGYCRIENVAIRFMGRNCIWMEGSFAHDSSVIDKCQLVNVDMVSGRLHGLRQYRTYDVLNDECSFVGSEQCGIYSESGFNMIFRHPLFNNNGQSFLNVGTNWRGAGHDAAYPCYDQAQMYLAGCNGFTVDRPDFEQWTGAGHDTGATWTPAKVPHALAIYGSNAGSITGVRTYTPGYGDAGVDSVLIFLGDTSQNIRIADCQGGDVTYALFAMDDRGVQGIKVEPFLIIDHGWGAPSGVHILNQSDTEGGGTPTGGNIVYPTIKGTDVLALSNFIAGITLPRVSASTAISTSPPEGTVIYDATAKTLKVWNGATWKTVTVT